MSIGYITNMNTFMYTWIPFACHQGAIYLGKHIQVHINIADKRNTPPCLHAWCEVSYTG